VAAPCGDAPPLHAPLPAFHTTFQSHVRVPKGRKCSYNAPRGHISEGGRRGIKGEAVIPPQRPSGQPPPRTRFGRPVAADGAGGGGVFGARAHLVPPRAGSAPSRRRRGRRRPGGGPFFHFSRLDSRQRNFTGNVSNEVARLPGVLYMVGESSGSPRTLFLVRSAQKNSPRTPRGQRFPRHLDEPRAAP
jgi:hypothetical protein